jgi:hypothetical protein
MSLFHHMSNIYTIVFIRLRSVPFVTLLHWFFKHLWNSTIFLSVALCINLVYDQRFYPFYREDGGTMFPKHADTHVKKKRHGLTFQKIIFMLMAVRHSVWNVFFCSVILPTSNVMFWYLVLYFRLPILYPYVWFSSVNAHTMVLFLHSAWHCLPYTLPLSKLMFLFRHFCQHAWFCSAMFRPLKPSAI